MLPSENTNPAHPGEILAELYMAPLGLSITALAQRLGCTRAALSEIIHGKRGVSPSMALRLGDAFRTGPEVWMNLQAAYDLHQARRIHHPVEPIQQAS